MRNVTHQDVIDAFRACGVDLPSLINGLGPTQKVEAFNTAKSSIDAEYKRLCRACHPDLHQDAHELATKRFQFLQQAFEIISHSEMKANEPRRAPPPRQQRPSQIDFEEAIERMRQQVDAAFWRNSWTTQTTHSEPFPDPPRQRTPQPQTQPSKKKWGGYGIPKR